ncbi:hypothetical protein MA9V1_092 [Chryseobacterium phage MA9V-1]|nr:hypothetical protein MA9V1_092 [Chryseobacterium phage MA9V-1]
MKQLLILCFTLFTLSLANAQLTFGTTKQSGTKWYVNPHGDPTIPVRQDIRFRPGPNGSTILSVNVGSANVAFRKEFVIGKQKPMTKADSIQAKKEYEYYMKNNIYARP